MVQVKCPQCEQKLNKEDSVRDLELSKRYYHPECFKIFKAEKERQMQENIEKDELCQVIRVMYGYQDFLGFSSRFWRDLENLRDGKPMGKKRHVTGRYKNGFAYPVIKQAYLECEESIKYALKTKDFQSTDQALFYGLAIVVNRIPITARDYEKNLEIKKQQELELQKEFTDSQIDYLNAMEDRANNYNPKNKKKKNNVMDISKFL